jgi:MFS family permease
VTVYIRGVAPPPPTGTRSGHIPVLFIAWQVNSVDVNTATDLITIGAIAAVWLTAGFLAETLPGVRTARELRRRAGALSMLVGGGIAVLIAAPVVAGTMAGDSAVPAVALLPAVPAVVVMVATARRVAWIRRGAGAFATAPLTPVPPALRAAAAHPLVATPLQVTGLAALAGVPMAAGVVAVPAADTVATVLTAAGLGVLALGVRHAIRHSRLTIAVLAPIDRGGLRALPTMRTSTPAEAYTALPDEPVAVVAAPADRAA